MKGSTITLILLGVVGVVLYMLWQSFENAETEVSNMMSGLASTPSRIWGGITGELSAFWSLITGDSTSEDADFVSGGGGYFDGTGGGGSW